MKKNILMSVLLVFGIFFASAAYADEWYNVTVLGGSVAASSGGIAAFSGTLPSNTVEDLDINEAPEHSVPGIEQLAFPTFAPPADGDSDGWNAAGWWTFAVTSSSGEGWNEVFASTGPYTFTADWEGQIQVGNDAIPMSVHFGVPGATFDDLYGKWIRNNDSVYTYFGLFVAPNTGAAQLQGPPIGIFAFVADDPLLYPSGFDLASLYGATSNGAAEVLRGGTGTFVATPEPTSLILLGTGLGVIGLAAWRRRK